MSSRRFGPLVLVTVLVLGVAAGVGATALILRRPAATATASAGAPHAHTTYVCPMHPSITSDKPGECPICGMQLVRDPRRHRAQAPLLPLTDGPQGDLATPRKDEMGMDYVAVYADEVGGGSPSVAGLATVGIDPQRQQLIGLRTAPVTEGAVGGSWRTVGRVAVDETRVHHVSLKFSGFIEQVFVDYIGKQVRAGRAAVQHLQPGRGLGRGGVPPAHSGPGPRSATGVGPGRRGPRVRGPRAAQALGHPGAGDPPA